MPKDKTGTGGTYPEERSASEQIDSIIDEPGDWRGPMLAQLRSVVRTATPSVIEEVKWKKPSKPSGVPVWSQDGILCVADTLKAAVRLTFPKGTQIPDPEGLFNTRLDSKSVRAIDFREGVAVNKTALRAIVVAAAELNSSNAKKR